METTTEAQLRQQLEDLQKKRVREARRCASLSGFFSIMALLGFVYGYVQNVHGQQVAEAAAKERKEAVIMREEATRQMAEAELTMKKLEELTIELEICKASKK